jgi:hypothetical protein
MRASAWQVAGIAHSSTALAKSMPQTGGYFYIAYNLGGRCGGLAMVSVLQQVTSAASVCGQLENAPLQAFSVRLDTDRGYPAVFLLIRGALFKLDMVQVSYPQ